jgi:hypothetical protein
MVVCSESFGLPSEHGPLLLADKRTGQLHQHSGLNRGLALPTVPSKFAQVYQAVLRSDLAGLDTRYEPWTLYCTIAPRWWIVPG